MTTPQEFKNVLLDTYDKLGEMREAFDDISEISSVLNDELRERYEEGREMIDTAQETIEVSFGGYEALQCHLAEYKELKK